jgi:hypothetical protein
MTTGAGVRTPDAQSDKKEARMKEQQRDANAAAAALLSLLRQLNYCP